MMSVRWLVVWTMALGGVACDDPIVVQEGDFQVAAEVGAFVVRNRSETLQSVHVIVESQTSALIDLAPCAEWSPRLQPGEDDVVPHEDVWGYTDGALTAIVYWCLLSGDEPVDGGTLTLPFR